MGHNVGVNVAWTLFITIPFLIGSVTLGYWIYRSVQLSKKFRKYLKSLLVFNWISICSFYLCMFMTELETLLQLGRDKDFSTEYEDPDLQVTFALSSLGYIVGKWSVYTILYLRLYYTLNKSAYSYNEKIYKAVKYAIIAEIIFTLIPTALFVIADDGPVFLAAQLAVIPFFLLDVGIPVALNIMFIKKTYQIGKTYFRISSRTSRSSRSVPKASTMSKDKSTSSRDKDSGSGKEESGKTLEVTGGKAPKGAQRAASVSASEDHGTALDMKNLSVDASANDHGASNSHSNLSTQAERATEPSAQSAQSGQSARDPSVQGSTTLNTKTDLSKDDKTARLNRSVSTTAVEESEKDLGDLFDAVSKVAVLAVIICISSILFFVIYIISTTSVALLPLLWWSSTADSACNMVCLVLAFEFARKWFNKFCSCCQNFCKKQVVKRVGQE